MVLEQRNSARRYSADDYRRIRDIAGDLFLGVHQGELDSTGLPPEMYLPKDVLSNPTRAKIKEAFVKRLEEGLDRFAQDTEFLGEQFRVIGSSSLCRGGRKHLVQRDWRKHSQCGTIIASNQEPPANIAGRG